MGNVVQIEDPEKKIKKTKKTKLSEDEIKRLKSSMDKSYDLMAPFRRNRLHVIKEYVGSNYSDEGSLKKLPINMINLYVNIFSRQLAANNPEAIVNTKHEKLKPFAKTLELGINHLTDEIDLQSTLHESVQDALFSMAIVKVGINKHTELEIGGVLHDVGQPFADPVELDNFTWDMTARRWEHMSFVGDRYRVDLEVAQNEMFTNPKAKDLVASKNNTAGATDKHGSNALIEGNGQERYSANSLIDNNAPEEEEFIPRVELWDVWIPSKNVVVTIAHDQLEGEILREIEWDGPESGPYHFLGMSDVPGTPMPLPPIANHIDLHSLINSTMRKIQRQMLRQKNILAVQEEATDDGNRVEGADDGDIVKFQNPVDRIAEIGIGGIDRTNMAAMLQFMDVYKIQAGNLDSLGGLGQQAETLGQEKIIVESSSVQIADMGARVKTFVAGIIKSLAFYLWQDPLISIPLVKRVPGIEGIEIPVTLTAEAREGDFLDYNFDIDPVSMKHKTAGGQLNKILTMVETLSPLFPLFEAQGIILSATGLIQSIEKYADLPELSDMFVMRDGRPLLGEEPVGERHDKTLPNNTTRTNVRVNRNASTNSSRSAAAAASFLGSGNEAQQATALRQDQ